MLKEIYALQKYGFCIVRNMIPTNKAHAFDKDLKRMSFKLGALLWIDVISI